MPKKSILWVLIVLLGSLSVYLANRCYHAPRVLRKEQAFSPRQVQQFEEIIHSYLRRNPQILLEMHNGLQLQAKQEKSAKEEKLRQNIILHREKVFSIDESERVILGNPQGEVVLVEFTQYPCPACKNAARELETIVKEHPELKVILIYWPFLGKDAIYTSKLVLASQKQHKAALLHHMLIHTTDPITQSSLEKRVKQLRELDTVQLSQQLQDRTWDQALKHNTNLATKLGCGGTPIFIVANRSLSKIVLVPEYTPNFRQEITQAIQKVR